MSAIKTRTEPLLEKSFILPRGIVEFVEYLDSAKEHLISEAIYVEGEKQGIPG